MSWVLGDSQVWFWVRGLEQGLAQLVRIPGSPSSASSPELRLLLISSRVLPDELNSKQEETVPKTALSLLPPRACLGLGVSSGRSTAGTWLGTGGKIRAQMCALEELSSPGQGWLLQVHHRAQECVRALRLFQGIAAGRTEPSILQQGWDLSVLKVPASAWGALGAPWISPACLRDFLLGWEGSVQSPSPSTLRLPAASPVGSQSGTRHPPFQGTLLIFPWLFPP